MRTTTAVSVVPFQLDALRIAYGLMLQSDGTFQRLDAPSDFLSQLAEQDNPANTQKAVAYDLALFFDFCLGGAAERDWRTANGRLFTDLIRCLRFTPAGCSLHEGLRRAKPTREATTIQRLLSSVRRFYRWAFTCGLVGEGVLKAAAAQEAPKANAKKSRDRLWPDEVDALMNVVSDRPDLHCIVEWLYSLGLRSSALVAIRFQDVHLQEEVARQFGCNPSGGSHAPHIHIRPRPDEAQPAGVGHKRADEWVLPAVATVTDRYKALLSQRLDVLGPDDFSPYVFVSLTGKAKGQPLTPEALYKRFVRLRPHVPLRNGRQLHPHMLRHTFASELKSHTSGSKLVIRDLMGHRSVLSQNVYMHPLLDEMVEAVQALGDYREERLGRVSR